MGVGTNFKVDNSEVIINALRIGYRHLDLIENYKNLLTVKNTLQNAFSSVLEDALGLSKECIWLTMKVANINNTTSTDHVENILNAVRTGYFDLLLYHSPFNIFDTESNAETSWRLFCELPKF